MNIREDFVRARSGREKAARRVEILDAAEALLRDSGNDRFAISTVAERVGVSKSTIFLYFSNKEELLLSLYTRATEAFFDRFKSRLHPGITPREYCEAFIDSALENPNMLVLRTMLASTIERAVSPASLIAAKQDVLHFGAAAAYETEFVLGLESGKGGILLKALINLTAGAAQADIMPFVDLDSVPEDVARLIRLGETRSSFLSGAELVLEGILA